MSETLFMFSVNNNCLIYVLYSSRPHPLVIAAHPSKANQFALGLTDGGVHVLEPLESEGKWDSAATDENSVNPGASAVDKTSR